MIQAWPVLPALAAASLVPARDRPYVDGSPNNSVYTQVLIYNGLGRLTGNWTTIAGRPHRCWPRS